MPVYGEEHGIKAAQDMAGRVVTLDTRTYQPDPVTLERVGAFLQRTIPRAYGPILYSKTCVSTLPPDRDFVIDTLPAYPQIALALGAGHGYKFSGLIGRILTDLSVDGRTQYEIAPFAVDRPILQMAEPPSNFLLRRETRSRVASPLS
jgi:sarcosine oxidase